MRPLKVDGKAGAGSRKTGKAAVLRNSLDGARDGKHQEFNGFAFGLSPAPILAALHSKARS